MVSSILKQAAGLLRKRKMNKRWQRVLLCMAVLVAAGTVAVLTLTGRAMTHKEEILDCHLEVHEHTEECYNEDGELTCGYEDFVVHLHDEAFCYNEDGELVCPLTETPEHVHTDECYEITKVLVCQEGAEEQTTAAETTAGGAAGHVHTDECYEKVLACETEEHTHGDDCYVNELTCESTEHTHGDGCYTSELTCANEDPEHEHTDECYTQTLTCGIEEHTHGEGCYQRTLACEKEEHTHTDDCYELGEAPVCGLEEGAAKEPAETETTATAEETTAAAHVHTEECYETVKTLICEEREWHNHTEECYDEEGNLICEIQSLHTHTEECYDEDGALICGLRQLEEHVHTEDCVVVVDQTAAEPTTEEEHVHDESCYDENGALICGYDEAETTPAQTAEETTEATEPEATIPEGSELQHISESYEYVDDDFRMVFYVEGDVVVPVKESETFEAPETDGEETLPADTENETTGEAQSEASEETTQAAESETTSAEENKDAAGESMEPVNEDEAGIAPLSEDGEVEEATPADGENGAQPEDEAQESEAGEPVADAKEETGELHFQVEKLSETSLAYAAILAGMTGETGEGAELLQAMELAWSLTWGGEQLDASGCNVTVEIIPADKLVEEYAQAVPAAADEAGAETEGGAEEAVEGEYRYVLQAVEVSEDDEVRTLGTTSLSGVEKASAMTVGLNERTLALCVGSRFMTAEEQLKEKAVPIAEDFDFEDDTFTYKFHIEGDVVLPEAEDETAEAPAESGADGEDAGLPADETEGEAGDEEESSQPDAEAEGQDGEALPAEENEEDAEGADEAAPAEDEEADAENGIMALNEDAEDGETESAGDSENENAALTDDEAEAGDETQAAGGETAAVGDEGNESAEEPAETGGTSEFELHVEQLAEDSEEYAAFQSYAEQLVQSNAINAVEEEKILRAVGYSLTYAGKEVDLSDCQITVEIASLPKPEEETEKSDTDEIAGEGVLLQAMMLDEDGQVNAAGIFDEATENAAEMEQNNVMLFKVRGSSRAVAFEYLPSSVNPKFKVQYYANLDVLATTGTNALPVIDTSGKKLPKNGKGTGTSPNGNSIKNIYVNNDGTVKTEKKTVEVYASRAFEYIKAPSTKYMDALVDNERYKLKEIWVLTKGKKEDSVNKSDWTIYTYSEALHFTNRKEVADADKRYVYIDDGAVLRFVYDTVSAQPDLKAAFYDYDISSGRMYTNVANAIKNSTSGITQTGNQKNGTLYYVYTKQAGINSAGNYSGSGTKLAFGNVNTGTTMGENLWNGNLLNKYNGTQGSHPTVAGTYQGCTFGLVTGLKEGKIQYASGVVAPKLFNEGKATGKTSYDKDQYSLKFIRNGDTYTLTAVNGTNATGLESFGHPSPNSTTTHTHIWTNDFWPMDSAESYGKNGHDLKFGSYQYRNNRAYAGSSTTGEPGSTTDSKTTFPYSDDGKDHNSYFGMNFAVEFELSKDYVGPLEYYFFGDDDMWVFLDDKLVCDIGGVHSSVGEYVNLWDYLQKGSEGKHTLTFFYTERGASGSTCWMQFTLPSVSSITPENETDYGNLRVEKTVTRVSTITGETEKVETGNFDTGEEFLFSIALKAADGTDLRDDYCYEKYDKDGNPIGNDLILHDGSPFTLKCGEYILVKYLPIDTQYTVKEEGVVKLVDTTDENGNAAVKIEEVTPKYEYKAQIKVDGVVQDQDASASVTGVIKENKETKIGSDVLFDNRFDAYGLPKTGGPGTMAYTMAGVLCVALGAGFVYRRKLRERRGRASL